jgi:hypothetical protein
MTCTCCQTPLTGGTDTFGSVGLEMCQSCWWALLYDGDPTLEERVKKAERIYEQTKEAEAEQS